MTRKSEEIQQEETYEASDTHKVTRVGDARLFGGMYSSEDHKEIRA